MWVWWYHDVHSVHIDKAIHPFAQFLDLFIECPIWVKRLVLLVHEV
jgi:hypothetical protein